MDHLEWETLYVCECERTFSLFKPESLRHGQFTAFFYFSTFLWFGKGEAKVTQGIGAEGCAFAEKGCRFAPDTGMWPVSFKICHLIETLLFRFTKINLWEGRLDRDCCLLFNTGTTQSNVPLTQNAASEI